MSEFENASVGIQKSGRLTEETLQWLNENVGSDFPISEDPFDRRRELADSSTGITVVGYSNGDTLKAAACRMVDLAVTGSDMLQEKIATPSTEGTGLRVVKKMGIATCRLVYAQPMSRSAQEEPVKRVVTSYPSITKRFLDAKGLTDATVDVFSGGIEPIARRGNYDGLVDIVGTGGTLEDNDFEEVESIYDCEAVTITAAPSVRQDLEILTEELQQHLGPNWQDELFF